MIHEVTYYQAKCDRCGLVQDEYSGEVTAYPHPDVALEYVVDYRWWRFVGADPQSVACPNCWVENGEGIPVFAPGAP